MLYPQYKSDQQKALTVFVCVWCLSIRIYHGPDSKWPSILPTSRQERHPLTRPEMIPRITVRKEKGIWSWREINEPVNWKDFSHFICVLGSKSWHWKLQSDAKSLSFTRWLVGLCQIPLLLAFDLIKLWLIVWYFGSMYVVQSRESYCVTLLLGKECFFLKRFQDWFVCNLLNTTVTHIHTSYISHSFCPTHTHPFRTHTLGLISEAWAEQICV